MGDMTKFNSAIEYYTFNVLLICWEYPKVCVNLQTDVR